MTDRELMKLALEAAEVLETLFKQAEAMHEEVTGGVNVHCQITVADLSKGLYAAAAIREALAEQPAQQQEPVAWLIWLHGPAGLFDHRQFAELEFERRNKEYPDPDRKLLPLYTSPPASKPWVGLTDEEIERACVPLGAAMLSFTEVARAIEAKLREKNT